MAWSGDRAVLRGGCSFGSTRATEAGASRRVRPCVSATVGCGNGGSLARRPQETLLRNAGVHPKVVSERLSNASLGITLDVYSPVLPSMQEEAAALIAGLVFATE